MKVIEWTEINGKKYPKKAIYLVSELPNREKGNGIQIDRTFGESDLQLD